MIRLFDQNFLIYPAGKTKHQAKEIISASGVHRIIEAVPEANIVLVRTTGLWGSRFSRGIDGKSHPMFQTIFWGIKTALKNLIFFTPRRQVTLEFVPAPADFPYKASRIEMNRWLEKWYNRPDGVKPQVGEEPGESLNLVSYSMWKEDLPEVLSSQHLSEESVDLSKISQDIQNKVKKKLHEMTQQPVDKITPEMSLGEDLGLDSLDIAEIIAFLSDEFDVAGIPVNELTSVGKVMGLAAKQVSYGENEDEEEEVNIGAWFKPMPHEQTVFKEGSTIPEVFLNICHAKGSEVACCDPAAGVLTYAQAKMRVLLLADYIKTLPGDYIGILLPSSVAAYLTVLACHFAGKVPLMVNWTVGPRHLESIISLSKAQVILSSWAFIDRLENVDLTPVEGILIMLEDARRQFTLRQKLKAFFRSKRGPGSLKDLYNLQKISKDDPAVLLFTSGTENLPKGVPLTHENVLSNERGAVEAVSIFQDDIILGMLPPFHSFGFTVTGLLPLLAGIRAAYYPDPTDGKGVARTIEKWGATIVCGTPAFLKGIFKNAKVEQLKTIRICFTGAEKAPRDLFQMVNGLGHCRLIEGYGITECSPILTANLAGDPNQGVGNPMPGSELCIVSIDGHHPLPQGVQGLILARGPNIFKGYINPGLSSPFVQVDGKDWYSTGDLGYLDPNGALILSGRLKRFIKMGGEMVSLASIEDALLKSPAAKSNAKEDGPSLAVCAKEDVGEKTKIFVFTCFPTTLDEMNRALKEAGFSNLVRLYKVQQVEEIPLLGSGKINYRHLETRLPSLMENNSELINTN